MQWKENADDAIFLSLFVCLFVYIMEDVCLLMCLLQFYFLMGSDCYYIIFVVIIPCR